MISEEAAGIASECRHYAMCKIDYLSTGLCHPGKTNHYVSYYPQGRMDLYSAISKDLIPVTERLIDIAETCTLCGICDKQCHFITGLQPMKVMKALKEYVETFLKEGKEVVNIEEDEILKKLRKVVGDLNASNDPAILVTYSDDPCPVSGKTMPEYIVLPATHEETLEIIRICNSEEIPMNVRGNGGSVLGLVMSKGVVIDTCRMKNIFIDKENWRADIGAGISAFELQKAVHKAGMRANTAEPSALVCANIMCSGILSTFSNTYGTGADNYLNAQFAGWDGKEFNLNDREAPNLFGFTKGGTSSPGICTNASIKLHPVTDDEEGIGVPFTSFEKAAEFCRELSLRRIGISISLLGTEYISTFIAPTKELSDKTKEFFRETLGINFIVLVIGDKYAVESIKKMADFSISNQLFQLMIAGLPDLINGQWIDLMGEMESDEALYKTVCRDEMLPLLETIIDPSPERIAEHVPEHLRDFYVSTYSKPEMTDTVWINTFRILSSRMGRHKHVVAFIGYVPLDNMKAVNEMKNRFKQIGDKYNIKHDYGFLTPVDLGKRAILEYDYYIDHTDQKEVELVRQVMGEAMAMVGELSGKYKGLEWVNTIFNQGFSRKEGFLYL